MFIQKLDNFSISIVWAPPDLKIEYPIFSLQWAMKQYENALPMASQIWFILTLLEMKIVLIHVTFFYDVRTELQHETQFR